MLLAPFTLSDACLRPRLSRRPENRPVPLWLQIWAVGGILATVLFPSLRGGELTGMSLPFWLVAAPMLNIVWLAHSRWWVRLRLAGSRTTLPRGSRSRRVR